MTNKIVWHPRYKCAKFVGFFVGCRICRYTTQSKSITNELSVQVWEIWNPSWQTPSFHNLLQSLRPFCFDDLSRAGLSGIKVALPSKKCKNHQTLGLATLSHSMPWNWMANPEMPKLLKLRIFACTWWCLTVSTQFLWIIGTCKCSCSCRHSTYGNERNRGNLSISNFLARTARISDWK